MGENNHTMVIFLQKHAESINEAWVKSLFFQTNKAAWLRVERVEFSSDIEWFIACFLDIQIQNTHERHKEKMKQKLYLGGLCVICFEMLA